MKHWLRIMIFLGAVLCLGSVRAYAQETPSAPENEESSDSYISMINEDMIWEYYMTYSTWINETRRMTFDGVREVGGRNYHIFRTIWKRTFDQWTFEVKTDESPDEEWLLREDGPKVYLLLPEKKYMSEGDGGVQVADGYREYPLYDFSVQTGDELPLYSWGERMVVNPGSVEVLDSIFMAGKERKVYRYAHNGIQSELDKIIFIEGIGVNFNGILPAINLNGFNGVPPKDSFVGAQLNCLYDKDMNVLYRNPDYSFDPVPGTLINENYIWEYNYAYQNGYVRFRMKFDGTEERDGKTYHRFRTLSRSVYEWGPNETDTKVSENEYANDTPFLLREMDGKVYLRYEYRKLDYLSEHLYPEDGEYLLYDFALPVGDVMPINFGGFSDDYKLEEIEKVNAGNLQTVTQYFEPVNGEGYRRAFNNVFGNLTYGTLVTIDYDRMTGSPHDPLPNCPPTEVGVCLEKVYDLDGNVVFDPHGNVGIEQITDDSFRNEVSEESPLPADRLFDLQGRELKEPMSGQPYIKGGKVLVAPK